jgi:ArsR family transcriptional regulator
VITQVQDDATQVCCAPLAYAAISEAEAEVLAARLKALADPVRLRLLSLIMASRDGELCTCDLVEPLDLSQPTVTHHLRRLAEAGIVTGESRGRWTYYRVEPRALDAIVDALLP